MSKQASDKTYTLRGALRISHRVAQAGLRGVAHKLGEDGVYHTAQYAQTYSFLNGWDCYWEVWSDYGHGDMQVAHQSTLDDVAYYYGRHGWTPEVRSAEDRLLAAILGQR